MKKILTVILALSFVFIFTSCSMTTDSVVKNLNKAGYDMDVISDSSGDSKLQLKQIKISIEETYNKILEGDILTVIEAKNQEDQQVFLYEFEKENDAITFYDILINTIESENPEKVISIDGNVVVFASDSKALADAK